MTDTADIAIVGGGAGGLAAAIFAAQAAPAERRIVILDGARTLGAKILVAGGGRCNVTHHVVTPDDFNGSRNIVRNVLAAFDAAVTVRWFNSMGVELKREETGKLFPVTDSARTVLNALLGRCRELGVMILTNARVQSIERTPETGGRGSRRADRGLDQQSDCETASGDPASPSRGSYSAPRPIEDETAARREPRPPEPESSPSFRIIHTGGVLVAKRVIVTTGGRSLPRSGSDGSGWEMVRAMGHTVTDTHPALVPLVLDPTMFHAQVSGISHEAELSTFVDGKRIDRRRGSLLWTHFGISGPVAMDASRHWVVAKETGKRPEMRCNFLPLDGFEQIEQWLLGQAASRPRASVVSAVAQRLPERVAAALVAHAKMDPATTLGQLSRESRRALAHALTALPLPVAGPRGWNYAEVTAGGVPLAEIDYRTMQSRKVPGLHLAGEILDCDGRIGGFNFQWAWATGYLAGTAAAKSL
jgi:predicted flavoprotein YhiN